MKNAKFRVLSPEHSTAIQTRLFELGFKWAGGGETHPIYLKDRFLYLERNPQQITRGGDPDCFSENPATERTLNDLYNPQIISEREVKPIKIGGHTVVFHSNRIEVGCTTVDRKTIEEIYKHFNP